MIFRKPIVFLNYKAPTISMCEEISGLQPAEPSLDGQGTEAVEIFYFFYVLFWDVQILHEDILKRVWRAFVAAHPLGEPSRAILELRGRAMSQA